VPALPSPPPRAPRHSTPLARSTAAGPWVSEAEASGPRCRRRAPDRASSHRSRTLLAGQPIERRNPAGTLAAILLGAPVRIRSFVGRLAGSAAPSPPCSGRGGRGAARAADERGQRQRRGTGTPTAEARQADEGETERRRRRGPRSHAKGGHGGFARRRPSIPLRAVDPTRRG
jgi:hypothetical protein